MVLNGLFQDKQKFKQILEEPTPSCLTSVQLAWVHGLPKIHKVFENVPSFCPMIATTGTTHYLVAKYLSELLNPLTHNEYSLKDSFNSATRISRILPQVRENDEYIFISLDVISVFQKAIK